MLSGLCKIQLLSKSLNTLSYFTQPPYHPSVVLLKILKSPMTSMHLVSFQNNSIFYNSYIKSIEQGVFRIKRITFSKIYYMVNLEKCEIVFKLLESNCIFELMSKYLGYFGAIIKNSEKFIQLQNFFSVQLAANVNFVSLIIRVITHA